MANLFPVSITNHLVQGLTALVFTTAVINPVQVHAAGVVMDIGSVNFGIKIERIFEKIKKATEPAMIATDVLHKIKRLNKLLIRRFPIVNIL